MESFVDFGRWQGPALLLNLIAFFLAFSALSVGVLIAARLKRVLAAPRLEGVVVGFLIASGGLAVRALGALLFHLQLLGRRGALVLGDLAAVAAAGGLFAAFVAFERYLRAAEAEPERPRKRRRSGG